MAVSSYHAARAYLTFVAALDKARLSKKVQIVVVPASHSPWFKSPDGMTETRLELLATEFAKIEAYQATGDCATFERALECLAYWEGK